MPKYRHWDWTGVVIVVWVGLVLGLAVFSYLFPWSHTVYDIYARSARRWWNGEDLYAALGTDYFRYSPSFAIALTPFSLFPDSWGGALWRVFSCSIYAAGLWAWIGRVLPLTLTRAQIGAFFLLVLPVSAHSMYNGQANLVMLGAVLFALAALVQEKRNQAAGWMALAVLIKGYPLALALLLGIRYLRGFFWRFCGTLLLGLLFPFATQSPRVVLEQYASWMAHLKESTVIMRERLRSLDCLFAIYGEPLSPANYLLLEVLAGLAVLGLCIFQARRTSDPRLLLTCTFQLFGLWVVLFGPATEACTYIVVAPALAWSLIGAFRRPDSWTSRFLLITSLLLMGPSVTDAMGSLRDFAIRYGSQPIGALLFLTYVLRQIVSRQSTGTTASSHQVDPSLEAAA